MSSKTNCGIVYIATSNEFVEEAEISARSVKSAMPGIPITLITDIDTSKNVFDTILFIEEPRHDFGDKVYNLERTPYKKTIFLDTDTYVTETICDLYTVLDQFDIAVANNQQNYASERVNYGPINELPESFPERNTGVIAYKSSSVMDTFFNLWQKNYETILEHGQKNDQASFRLALYRSDIRVATLPSEYNCRFRNPGSVNGKVKIFHGRLIETHGGGANKTVDVENAISVLNNRTGQRAYYMAHNKVKIAKPSILELMRYSLKENGFIGTVKRSPPFIKRKFLE